MAGTFSIKYIFEAVDRYSASAKRMQDATKKLSRSIANASKNVKQAGANMTKFLTLPIAGIGTAAGISFAKMEKGLANVFTLLSKEEIEKFGDQIQKAQENSIKMGFSIDDTNKSLFDFISSLGISENTLKGYADAQKLSVAGNAEMSASVLGMGKILNVYGKQTTDTNKVINAFFTAQKVGTTTVQDLALNVGTVAGGARTLGLDFDTTLATMAIFTNTLKSTEVSATSLNAIFNVLADDQSKGAKILNALGVATGATKVEQVGFVNVLKQLQGALKKNKDAVFQAIPEQRALKAIANLTEESLATLSNTIVQIGIDTKEGTGLTEALKIQMATLSYALGALKGRGTLLLKQLFLPLVPALLSILKSVNNMIKKLEELSPEQKKIIAYTAVFIAALGPLLLILGQIGMALPIITAAFSPLGIVIGGIVYILGLLTTAVIAVYQNWDILVEYFSQFKIVQLLIIQPFKNLYNLIGLMYMAIKVLAETIKILWKAFLDTPLMKFIIPQFEKLKKIVDDMVESLAKLTGITFIKDKLFGKVEEDLPGMDAIQKMREVMKANPGITEAEFNRQLGIQKFEANNNINQSINITAPKGTTVATKSKGDNVNLGVNMQGA